MEDLHVPHHPHYPPPPCDCAGKFYRVKPGDTLYNIAQRFGISLDAIIRANPQIPDPNLIYPGQVICVPGVYRREYCIILTPERYVHPDCGGICWIKTKDRHTEVLVLATGLPDPSTYGADCYKACFEFDGRIHEVRMRPLWEDPVFLGIGLFPFLFPTAFFLGGAFRIFPGPVLGGFFI
ncbi:MAG TPA: SafA/ExsA family spore coat assembly protein [Syntrophomonadaceae bacterium]|nr:SafA/ExsA family spore coat assembly protein [Syntrophomonadaceae bacterium]